HRIGRADRVAAAALRHRLARADHARARRDAEARIELAHELAGRRAVGKRAAGDCRDRGAHRPAPVPHATPHRSPSRRNATTPAPELARNGTTAWLAIAIRQTSPADPFPVNHTLLVPRREPGLDQNGKCTGKKPAESGGCAAERAAINGTGAIAI